jgi:hypothetical protein
MKYSRLLSTACLLAVTIASLMFSGGAWASGPTETTLYSFLGNPDGCNPIGPVVFDKAGNIYGTTQYCGQLGNGSVFELSPPAIPGGAWTEAVLYSFTGGTSDGGVPSSGVILDSKGALYGTTLYGGYASSGTVFKLAPPAIQGGAWTETTLYRFCSSGTCTDGIRPSGGLVFDKKGDLYGTASGGGNNAIGCCGVVFELTPRKQGLWRETVLYTFLGNYFGQSDGYSPQNGVIFDTAGNLYGTTLSGGDYSACQNGGCGVVFELSLSTGSWSESLLYVFQGTGDGNGPSGSLVFDKAGALYGTTSGESVYNSGNVFRLTPPVEQGGPWTESVLYSFQGLPSDGSWPQGVTFVGKNLFGTTALGGLYGGGCCDLGGIAFKLTPPRTGTGAWTETILWNFGNGFDGHGPNPLTLKGGAFYSTDSDNGQGCQFGCGTVFKLVP